MMRLFLMSLVISFFCLFNQIALAANQTELLDINSSGVQSDPKISDLVILGDYAYFSADDGIHGVELWRTNGTAQTTELVKDINLGSAGSDIRHITAYKNHVYFWAEDSSDNTALWRSDGTEQGTILFNTISPQSFHGNGYDFEVFSNELYFAASDGTTGDEIWKTDGTQLGTVLVKDIDPGVLSSIPNSLTVVGNQLFFRISFSELWKTDGTTSGTVKVNDIEPHNLVDLNGDLIFTNGPDLWMSDGSESGTVVLRSFDQQAGSYFSDFYIFNGELFFDAALNGSGSELWKTDGTVAGTVKVKEIVSGGSSSPKEFAELNSQLYFTAWGQTGSRKLWKTDGTSAGTQIVINPGVGNNLIYLGSPFSNGQTIFFKGHTSQDKLELWKTNGSLAGTQLVKNIVPNDLDSSVNDRLLKFTNFDDEILFVTNDGQVGLELWKSDGTVLGTVLVSNIDVSTLGSHPRNIVNFKGKVYFTAENENEREQLWVTDSNMQTANVVKSSSPDMFYQIDNLTVLGDNLFFESPHSLWKSDGADSGTVEIIPGQPMTNVNRLTKVNQTLFFEANQGELWKSNGTDVGTVMVKEVSQTELIQFTVVNDKLFFVAEDDTVGKELWVSNGISSGTYNVIDIYPGSNSSSNLNGSDPRQLTDVDGVLYFIADTAFLDGALWKSDGTEAGTLFVRDIKFSSFFGNSPTNLTAFNNQLYFIGNTGLGGFDSTKKLWRSDGTFDGTIVIKDLGLDYLGTDAQLESVGNELFIFTSTGDFWKTTGTEATTTLVRNFDPVVVENGVDIANVNNIAFMALGNKELWMSEGTNQTTKLIEEFDPDPSFAPLENLTNINGRLYFSANDGIHGQELWRTNEIFIKFADVANNYFAIDFIEALFKSGITGGCNTDPLSYCPTATVTRAQMAVFLEKAINGSDFAPPPAIGLFSDVQISSGFAPWIEQLSADGITGGCGVGKYCPNSAVTRAQMAVFLLKAKYGSSYTPPTATGVFTDVAISSGFAPWIEQLALEGITGGCVLSPLKYCPNNPVTRAQMAVFLVKAFNISM